MRNLIFVAVLATSVSSLSFFEKAQQYMANSSISGSGSASASGSASGAGTSFLSGLQNTSFGQTVMGGIDAYNQAKNGNGSTGSNWQTAIANTSWYQAGANFFNNGSNNFIDSGAIQQAIANSSMGVAIQSGINYYNDLKNGNSPFSGDASSIIGSFVPFLANASTEAKTEFYAILPNVGNMTIAEFESAVNAWAAKYGLTEEVEAFNQRSQNMTVVAEEHANAIVMNLPNVLNNLKAISSDKNQTVMEMHTRMMAYVNSLDDDTQDIVYIFFRNLLPPNFQRTKCSDNGNFLSNLYQKASEYFAGNNSTSGQGNGNGISFGSAGSFWNSFTGNGNKNSTGNEKPHPMLGLISNFMNKNNISDQQASSVMNGVQSDGGFASVQILPAQINVGDASLASDAQIGLAVIDPAQGTTKKNKKQQQQANKNKKKATTVAPLAADANVALAVHAQVL